MKKYIYLLVFVPVLSFTLSGCFIIEGILGPKFTDEDSCEVVFVYYKNEYGENICAWTDSCCGGGCGLSRRGEKKRAKYQLEYPERDYSVSTCCYTLGEEPCSLDNF